jgi:hypothetical protein
MNLISSQNLSALCLRRIAKPFPVYQTSASGVTARQLNPHSSAGAFCAPHCRIAGNGASHARPMAIAITAAGSAIATFLALSICRRIFRSESCFVSSLSRAASMTRIIDEGG